MKLLLILVTFSALLLPIVAFADDPVTFEEAKRLSSQEGKQLLLEFFHDD